MIPRRSAESGSVMIVMALMLLTIIGFIAVAVDTTLMAASKSQHQHMTQYAALAALEEYLSDKHSPGNYAARLSAAAVRASDVSKLNFYTSLMRSLPTDSSMKQTDLAAQPNSPTGLPDSDKPNGFVIPGRWHFQQPPAYGTRNKECKAGAAFKPCFEEIAPTERANALKIELYTNKESGLRTMFGKALGMADFSLESHAVASLIPRHGIFVLDTSTSIVEDTHKPPAYYAYQLSGACPPSGATPQEVAALLEPVSRLRFNQMRGSSDGLAGTKDTRGAALNGHYADDYKGCITVDVKPDGAAVSETVRFVVDTYYKPVGGKDGPEPLTAALDGVHVALDEFQKRAVSADRVGVIAFDDRILDARLTKDNYYSQTKSVLIPPISNETKTSPFDLVLAATNTAVDITEGSRSGMILFPTFYGGEVFGNVKQSPFTDLRAALTKAVSSLETAENSSVAERFIVLFSDGITNCVNLPPGADPAVVRRCANNMDRYEASMTAAQTMISEFAPDKRSIALHLLLTGDQTRPHSLILKKGNRCMTDTEARSLNPTSGNVNPVGGSIKDSYFYGPNALWEQAVKTLGVWSPLRPCCRDSSGNCKNVTQLIGQACADKEGADGTPIYAVDGFSQVLEIGDQKYTQMHGERLICDPFGRDKKVQTEEIIRQIMNRNPYLLVQ